MNGAFVASGSEMLAPYCAGFGATHNLFHDLWSSEGRYLVKQLCVDARLVGGELLQQNRADDRSCLLVLGEAEEGIPKSLREVDVGFILEGKQCREVGDLCVKRVVLAEDLYDGLDEERPTQLVGNSPPGQA